MIPESETDRVMVVWSESIIAAGMCDMNEMIESESDIPGKSARGPTQEDYASHISSGSHSRTDCYRRYLRYCHTGRSLPTDPMVVLLLVGA